MTYYLSQHSFNIIILSIVLGPLALIFLIVVGSNEKLNNLLNRAFAESRNPLLVVVTILICTLLLVTLCCMAVHPYDGFEDYTNISAAVTAAEIRTCKLIARADIFLESDIGGKGMETDEEGNSKSTPMHREYVLTAQRAARAPANNNIVECGMVSAADIDVRLTRLEATLRQFVSPVLLRTFDSGMNSSMACTVTRIPCHEQMALFTNDKKRPIDESMFMWTSDPKGDPKNRLTNIVEALNCYEKRILNPLDEKVARMKRGDLSECEKKNAAKSKKD